MELVLTIGVLLVTIARLVINIIIYRSEYDYNEYTDGVAVNFDKEEVAKRDTAVVLWTLALFTLFWRKVKNKNKAMSVGANILSIAFFGLLVGLFLIQLN